MLWRKAWLDTRWRFVAGLGLLLVMACGIVITYPTVVRMRPLAASLDPGDGVVGRAIREAMALQRDYRGYVWSQWFGQNLVQAWSVLAALMGSGGLLASGRDGAALFTLTLPVSRRRVYAVRAASGLAALAVLAIAPSLLIPLLSPSVGEHYAIGDALVHGLCLFLGGTVIYSIAVALSAVFADVWRPMLLALAVAVGLAAIEIVAIPSPAVGVIHAMTGELYFRSGTLPWLALAGCVLVSGLILAAGARAFERQDF